MALFGWGRERSQRDDVLDVSAGPDALLRGLDNAVPRYLEKTDRGDLVYPACKRGPNDARGSARDIWQDTRLEALRYLTLIPGRDSALLTEPPRQAEVIEGFLRQQPHEAIVIDLTGRAVDDIAISVVAGLNWLNHCAVLARADRAKVTGTMRNFRKAVGVALRWWAAEGAETRCREMLAARQLPPMMLSLAWLESTTLAKEIAAAAAFNAGAVQADDAWARFQAAGDPNELSG